MTPIDEFSLDPELIYLNHAAVAPWPKRAAEAAKRFAEENVFSGATFAARWLEEEQCLRQLCAKLINAADPDDIAIVKNTSEALSMVAHGLTWEEGDEVVISDQEFPSNRIVWEALAPQGVKVIEASLTAFDTPEEAIINACSSRTKLISISSVQYATGLRMDLPLIGKHAKEQGILYCVDAIQSLGALTFDLQTTQADFVMADAHKWLLGPEGTALFYSSPQARNRLRLHEFGWHMVETLGDYDRKEWEPAHTARRFECGSPNTMGEQIFKASLELLLEVGLVSVETQILSHHRYLRSSLSQIPGIEILSPEQADRQSGILLIRISGLDDTGHKRLHKMLLDQKVMCAYRGKGLRFSPHFYTPQSKLDSAIHILRNCLNQL